MGRINHILHATDFSTASRRAFTTAVDLARTLKAKLTLVYVIAPLLPMAPEQYVDAGAFDRIEAQTRDWSAQQLKRLANRVRKAGVRVATELREGDAATQIVRAAKSRRADLIVVGTHGRGVIPKFFLGSVADRVIKTATCPVTAVRGR
jgi:nucleotide-binding universal stress UspA family protein